MVSLTTKTGNMVTTEKVEEAVWSNDFVSDVDVGHSVDVMFDRSQKYYWKIKFIGDRNFYVKYNMLGGDVTKNKFLAVENPMNMWIDFIPLNKFKLYLSLIGVCRE